MKQRILKYKRIFTFAFIALFAAMGCNKYVDKKPLDQFSDLDYWTSEDKVKTFCWSFYDLFAGYGNGSIPGDFYFTSLNDDQASPTFQDFDKNAPATDGSWGFGYIRKANLVIDRVQQVPMDDEAKKHWTGVARFFRALNYFELVRRFGDVPWYSQVLDISQDSLIYKPRDPRNMVMDSVLADLNFAVANLRPNTGDNTVNKDVALALKSRVCLYEGTYSEYQENDNARAAAYLEQSKDASAKLLTAGYSLTSEYQTIYNSLDLSGNPEIILYKQYEPGILEHSVIGYTNSSTPMRGLTKAAVESYVCTDGLPIGLSSKYKGDDNIQNVRTNRDGRLLQTIDTFYCYDGSRVEGLQSSTGYRPSKFLNPEANQLAPHNETDGPIFWLAEILENYAEAAAELDKMGKAAITQHDLDISLNLLRARAGVAPLELSGSQGTAVNGVPFTDPQKDADVTSLIWEIRRDRRAELMMDGFRFDDLVRWKKGEYMDSEKNPDCVLGAKVPDNGTVKRNAAGYIMPYDPGLERTFQPRNYLSPIPTGQIALYPDGVLKQNEGW